MSFNIYTWNRRHSYDLHIVYKAGISECICQHISLTYQNLAYMWTYKSKYMTTYIIGVPILCIYVTI